MPLMPLMPLMIDALILDYGEVLVRSQPAAIVSEMAALAGAG